MSARSSRSAAKLTPMLAQYLDIKKEYAQAILLFRMGDFYETFFDDAERLAELCGVTLTSRDRNSDHPVPLAGVPHHALDTYLNRLLQAGVTVAICEQVEDPATAKGLVKRAVVEVISPGTATSPELIDSDAGHYCLAYTAAEEGPAGWALLDASTGDFRCGLESSGLQSLVERYAAREVIVSEAIDLETLQRWRAALLGTIVNTVNAAWYHPGFAADTLQNHFGVRDLAPFDLVAPERQPAVACAGALLRYLTTLSLQRPAQVTTVSFATRRENLVLDEETLRNLEIFRTMRGDKGEGTLVHHLDATCTPMGRRLLARRLAEPMTDLERLARWHRGVDGAVRDRDWRERLRELMRGLVDLERCGVLATAGRLGPARARQLGEALRRVDEIVVGLRAAEHDDHPAVMWAAEVPELADLSASILATLVDQPPATTRTAGYIREGVDERLDEAAAIARDSKGYLARLQADERERSGIPNLKVGFNKVFGYYFEVTNKHLDKVPDAYVQKQTLVNAARFHTDELKEAEQRILDAEVTIQERETGLFASLLERIAGRLADLRAAASRLARIDLMFAYADLAERRAYCRPVCDDSLALAIDAGRHPVIELLTEHDFIPNDTALDSDSEQIMLLTGPNMGGKSTYLRQVALIVLMAQAGGFVPASRARIGVADRIFTRVGASDNLARGHSTFFAEMSETARILHQMTRRSFVILDEVGRGTSTHDGLSLAWAITEHLHQDDGPRPRTIFATHYHELTTLADDLPRLRNMRLDVKEWEGRIIFLHAVRPGASDRSYGVHVARLAGVPEPVLRRAEALLADLSHSTDRIHEASRYTPAGEQHSLAADAQLSLFSDRERDALEALKDLDLEHLSPLDAFMWLARIRRQLEEN